MQIHELIERLIFRNLVRVTYKKQFSTLAKAAGCAAIMLIVGCGGSKGGSNSPVNPTVSLTGNWSLSTASSAFPGTNTQIAAALTSSGVNVVGFAHVVNSPCYGFSTDVPISGQQTGSSNGLIDSDLTLATSAISNQILNVNGVVSGQGSTISGTYAIAGGCGNGDKGTLGGTRMAPLTGTYVGTIVSATGTKVATTALLTQSSTSDADGFFHMTGSATFTGSPCVTSATIVNASTDTLLAGNGFAAYLTSGTSAKTQIEIFGTFDPAAHTLAVQYQVVGGLCTGDSGGGALTKQ